MNRLCFNLKNKIILLNLAAIFVILWCFFAASRKITFYNSISDHPYIISNAKCQIKNVHPFNKDVSKFYKKLDYINCTQRPLLTYIFKTDNHTKLKIHATVGNTYGPFISCCYANVSRIDDTRIHISACQQFNEETLISESVIKVTCENLWGLKIYENVHYTIQTKKPSNKNAKRPLSVAIIAIDSVSRLNFQRTMPLTQQFLQQNNFLSFDAYNKIGHNTYPNLMGLLTGIKDLEKCTPGYEGYLDKSNCSIIWNDFKNLSYVTAYAEDSASMHTFPHYFRLKGFEKEPTDYYLSTYFVAAQTLSSKTVDGLRFCTGPEVDAERLFNFAEEFLSFYENAPYFAIFWANSFSHNDINTPSRMDARIKRFFSEIINLLDDTVVVFLSDHGVNYGNYRLTHNGWMEERLPFLHIRLPIWFQSAFPSEYKNMHQNSKKLTSTFDVYLTFRHILRLVSQRSGQDRAEGCARCKSLFEEIEEVRSCEDAGVQRQWCACENYENLVVDREVEAGIGDFFVGELNKIVRKEDLCAEFKIVKVLNVIAGASQVLIVKIRTQPDALFEAMIFYDGKLEDLQFGLVGDINRMDLYAPHSKCVSDFHLKRYCYCK